jgi:hypothetical protein
MTVGNPCLQKLAPEKHQVIHAILHQSLVPSMDGRCAGRDSTDDGPLSFLRQLSNPPITERLTFIGGRSGRQRSTPMRYLCLVYVEERAFDEMSEIGHKRLQNDSLDHDDELRRSGHLTIAAALQPVTTATTVRVRNGKVSMTDGPFAETKEHLGGFLLIEACDLNEAIQLASKVPMARIGSIEVRPIMEFGRHDLGE